MRPLDFGAKAFVAGVAVHGGTNGAKRRLNPTMRRWRAETILTSRNDFSQFRFIEAERFFAEDMFATIQGSDHLFCMQMMASGNDHGVD